MDIYKQIEDYCAKQHGVSANSSKKSIGDFVLAGNHPVNVKSNNVAKANYSPNIISAKRLLNWLKNPENMLSIIFVDYEISEDGTLRVIKDSGLVPIEHLSWECLTIEAQGWGVIQMCKELKIDQLQDRPRFLQGLKKAYEVFLLKEKRKSAEIKKLIKDL